MLTARPPSNLIAPVLHLEKGVRFEFLGSTKPLGEPVTVAARRSNMGRNDNTSSIVRRALAGLGLAALALTACGGAGESGDTASVEDFVGGDFEAPVDESTSSAMEAEAPADIEVPQNVAAEPTTGGTSTALPNETFGRDIITEVGILMNTSDVRQTTDDVRRLTVENGGAVFSSDVTIGDTQDDGSVPGGGTIVVRIPPQDLNRLVDELDGLGLVSRITQDSEDVTDQLVDLEIRIRQERAGIERIEALLGQAVELDDLFSIETELNRRQVDLERLLAAQRSTEDRVSLATLTVSIDYRAPNADPIVVDETDDGIGDAFSSGWNAFVGVLFAVGIVLAVSAPFLVLGLVVVGLGWLVTRRMRRRSTDHPVLRTEHPERDLVTPGGETANPED
jgi:hypothetical protein